MGRQFFRLFLAVFSFVYQSNNSCDEDKFPFLNSKSNDKVKSLLKRAQNIFKNSTVMPNTLQLIRFSFVVFVFVVGVVVCQ